MEEKQEEKQSVPKEEDMEKKQELPKEGDKEEKMEVPKEEDVEEKQGVLKEKQDEPKQEGNQNQKLNTNLDSANTPPAEVHPPAELLGRYVLVKYEEKTLSWYN